MTNLDNTYTLTIYKMTPVHIYFQIHVNHALAGSIVLRLEEFEHFKECLKPEKIYNNCDNNSN